MTKGVFSEFEVIEQAIKVNGASEATFKHTDCIGSSNQEMEVKLISKKCRGVLAKQIVKGTGAGTLEQSLHMPKDVADEMYGMDGKGLVTGVKGYGRDSVHPEATLVQKVRDEDGVVMLKAYPRVVVTSGKSASIENGAEEVAEISVSYQILPDENGYGVYEALAEDVKSTISEENWMTKFTPELVKDNVISA